MYADNRHQRMQHLRELAEQAMRQGSSDSVPAPEVVHDLPRALEDLRIHQIELELQNDELQRAQQQALLASTRYQMMFDHLPAPAFLLDAQGRVQADNQVARDWLCPNDRARLSPFRLTKALQREDRQKLLRTLADSSSGQSEQVCGARLTDAQGVQRWVDLHLMRLPADFHADAHCTLLVRDRTTEAARQSERKLFQALLDGSADLITASDTQGRVLLANQALLQMLNLPLDKVLGQRREYFMPLRDAILHEGEHQQVVRSGTAVTVTEQWHGNNVGGVRQFMTQKFPLRNDQGQTVGVGCIGRDVTEQIMTQKLQRISETVFQSASEAIIVADIDGIIVRVNPAFEKMSGFSAASVLGRSTRILRSGRQDQHFYTQLWEHLRACGHWEGELVNRSADGGYYTVWSSISAIYSAHGEVHGYIAVQTNLTPLRQAQTELVRMASFDTLTGLPNRALLLDRLGNLLSISERQQSPFGVLFVDLDHFKEVNDTMGHQVGDELLQLIARRLQAALRKQDTVGRMGGDEFVVLLPATDASACQAVAQKIRTALQQPLALTNLPHYRPQASLGLAMYPGDGQSAEILLRNADTAMYAAKAHGRNCAEAYSAAMSAQSANFIAVQSGLAQAIDHGEMCLYFQPRFKLADHALEGAEVLVRWQRPGHGLLGPADFLAVAEKSGLLQAVDAWVLQQAMQTLGRWRAQGWWADRWRLSVNLTAIDLQQENFLPQLRGQLQSLSVPAELLEFELNEGALIRPTSAMLELLRDLRQLGLALSIDDFGTGYSSLAYLKQLPVSEIKIDRSFVADMLDNESNQAVVEAIISVAHKLGLAVVAEGVETPNQSAALQRLGCASGQGFLLSPAMSMEQFERDFLRHGAAA